MKTWITYSYNDRAFVGKLKSLLKDSGLEFQETENEILPGDNIVDTIYKSIKESEIIFIIISKESCKREWFSTELAIIISEIRNNPDKRIFPILIEKEISIPPFIDHYQYLDLSDKNNFDLNIGRLKKSLKSPKERELNIEEKDNQRFNLYQSKQELLKREKESYEKKKVERQRLVTLTTLMTIIVTFVVLFVFIISNKTIFKLDGNNLISSFILVLVGSFTGAIISLILNRRKENNDGR